MTSTQLARFAGFVVVGDGRPVLAPGAHPPGHLGLVDPVDDGGVLADEGGHPGFEGPGPSMAEGVQKRSAQDDHAADGHDGEDDHLEDERPPTAETIAAPRAPAAAKRAKKARLVISMTMKTTGHEDPQPRAHSR